MKMTKMIYMVELDFQRKVGSVLFEDAGTAHAYATQCQAKGLNALVIPRVVITDTLTEWTMRDEVALAS
jgi:hypothetical protein